MFFSLQPLTGSWKVPKLWRDLRLRVVSSSPFSASNFALSLVSHGRKSPRHYLLGSCGVSLRSPAIDKSARHQHLRGHAGRLEGQLHRHVLATHSEPRSFRYKIEDLIAFFSFWNVNLTAHLWSIGASGTWWQVTSNVSNYTFAFAAGRGYIDRCTQVQNAVVRSEYLIGNSR